MSKKCKVPFCGMKYNMRQRCPGLSFHEIPADLILREKWLKIIRRKDFIPQDSDRICSIHFQPSDFKTGLKVVRLKPDAVPSIFPNYPKYLQPKNKPERRKIKRATPEVIASFKRARKVRENGNDCQADLDNSDVVLNTSNDSRTEEEHFGPVEVEYEVIPIDNSLQGFLQNSLSKSRLPVTRDASTQASGMWDKIQELYRDIRKLRTELQKKTNEMSSLTRQNVKLQKQLSRLRSEKAAKAESEKKSAAPPAKKEVVKENVSVRTEDINSYFHPRVPRSLCPPKNRNVSKTPRKVVLSVNHLNQITVAQEMKTPALLNSDALPVNNNSILFSRLTSVPKHISENISFNHHGLNSQGLTAQPVPIQNEPSAKLGNDKPTCVTKDASQHAVTLKKPVCNASDSPADISTERSPHIVTQSMSPKAHVQDSLGLPTQDYKENTVTYTEFQPVEIVHHVTEPGNKFVLVPENCVLESHGSEVIIYSSEEANGFIQEGIQSSVD